MCWLLRSHFFERKTHIQICNQFKSEHNSFTKGGGRGLSFYLQKTKKERKKKERKKLTRSFPLVRIHRTLPILIQHSHFTQEWAEISTIFFFLENFMKCFFVDQSKTRLGSQPAKYGEGKCRYLA